MQLCAGFSCLLLLLSSVVFCAPLDHVKLILDKPPVQSLRNIDYVYVINLDHRPQRWESTVEQLAPYGIIPYRFSAVNGKELPIEVIWDLAVKFQHGMRAGGIGTVFRLDRGKEYLSYELIEEEGVPYLEHYRGRGMIGCLLSHLSVLYDAYCSGYQVIWVCEDDIEVVRDPTVLSNYIDDLDRLLGREHWDILFTFREYRGPQGQYLIPHGGNYRPNLEKRPQEEFDIDSPISPDLRQIGPRFGTHSMILSQGGIKKILDFYQAYGVFMPYDLDLVLIPGIKMYSVMEDVVVNQFDSGSDIGSPPL